METILHRIQQIATNEGIKITAFEKSIGASKGVLSRAITNGTDIQSKWLQLIVENYPRYNEAWLLTGKGSMLKEETVPLMESKKPESVVSADLVHIPIVDISVAAGSGYNNPNYIDEVDSITMPSTMVKNGKKYLCVRVKGQSMIPSIQDGGYLVIRMVDRIDWDSIRDNYVYVVSDTEGKAYVKRLKNRLHQHGFVVCMSDNADKQNFPNFNLYEEELHTIWYAEWYLSAKIPNIQETYFRRQAELEDRVEELSNQFQQIQKALNLNNQ